MLEDAAAPSLPEILPKVGDPSRCSLLWGTLCLTGEQSEPKSKGNISQPSRTAVSAGTLHRSERTSAPFSGDEQRRLWARRLCPEMPDPIGAAACGAPFTALPPGAAFLSHHSSSAPRLARASPRAHGSGWTLTRRWDLSFLKHMACICINFF